jgi:formylglycine-generating enzyme required for sulfatase activity
MGTNPSQFSGIQTHGYPTGDFGTDLSRPVELVSWNDAAAYCAAFTKQERAAGRIPLNCIYRLPTEAEWEYACRAWTSTRFSYGDDPGMVNFTKYGWFTENSSNTTHAVGQKLPNPWGLYDIHGNVWEWCLDWYGKYPGGSAVNPTGPATGSNRVVRGGNMSFVADTARSASRFAFPPNYISFNLGFRIVLVPGDT